ncbi:MAG: DUF445 family protein [Deltaproteobacteria bacterium]|nr:DUF445 family protein [Candidatus Anaeroferrophillus wilburensis]MBN2888915.1 DUF445 family protein [Deltaproteobacteria bacterium]
MNYQSLIPYLAPPLVGAAIGYFTNYLAIRMLFRPLEQKKFCGIPVPMTPGIIPAKRKELATNIGRMIGDHLLTHEVIVSRLQRRDFQDGIYLAIARRFQDVFEQDLGTLSSLFPADFHGDMEHLVDRSRHYLYGMVDQLVEHPATDRLVDDFVRQLGDQLLAANLSSIIDVDAYARFRLRLRDGCGNWLRSDAVKGWVAKEFDQGFSRLLATSKPLAQVIPSDLRELLIGQLKQELPGLMASLSRLLYDPNIRQRIKNRIHQAIDAYVSKMGFWKKLLASWALQEDLLARKIDELVDVAGEDIAAALQQPQVQEKVMQLIADRFDAFLQIPVNELAKKVSYQKLAGIRDYLKGKFLDLLGRQETTERCFTLFEQLLMTIRDRSFSQLAEAVGFEGVSAAMGSRIGARLIAELRSSQVKRHLTNHFHELVCNYFYQTPIGKLSLKIPYEVLERGIAFTHRKACNLMETELPNLTDRIDIPAMVEERINALPVLQVEALLMDIMREHFTYINIFGGVLGAMIGGFQVVFMRFFY